MKLLDQVRHAARVKHFSYRTEQCYVHWIERFIRFHDIRHPNTMGAPEVERFLTHLAVEGHVAASTQNQALAALLFLYRGVLKIELGMLDAVRARRPHSRRFCNDRDSGGCQKVLESERNLRGRENKPRQRALKVRDSARVVARRANGDPFGSSVGGRERRPPLGGR